LPCLEEGGKRRGADDEAGQRLQLLGGNAPGTHPAVGGPDPPPGRDRPPGAAAGQEAALAADRHRQEQGRSSGTGERPGRDACQQQQRGDGSQPGADDKALDG
jgi:hypothetical protein